MGVSEETSMDHRFDGLFATVAEQAGGIEPLFDFFFGFLCRKTDFFTVGHAACKEMLDKSFRKWTQKAREKEERESIEREKERQQQREQQKRQQQQRIQQMDLENRPKVEELTEEEEAVFSQAANKPAAAPSKCQSAEPEGFQGDGSAQAAKADISDGEASASRPEGNGGSTDKYSSLVRSQLERLTV